MYENAIYETLQLAVFSTESMTTNTTKTFTSESSPTDAIVQTWTATAGILLIKNKVNFVQLFLTSIIRSLERQEMNNLL